MLFVYLFGLYFAYFAIAEDLMVRFKLTNLQVVLLGLVFGIFAESVLTGNLFNPWIFYGVRVAGINLGSLLIIGVAAWGFIQGNVTFYFANRIEPRDWNHPRMGPLGWLLCLGYEGFIAVLSQRNPVTPRGTWVSDLGVVGLELVVLVVFLTSLRSRRRGDLKFQPLPLLDLLAFGSLIIFIVLGTFVGGAKIVTSLPLNREAAVLETIWAVIVTVIFLSYRLERRAEIVV